MFGFIFFLFFPFILAWLMGIKRAAPLGIACAITLLVLGMGFVTGLLFTWFIERPDYWRAYHWPGLLASQYADSIGYDDPQESKLTDRNRCKTAQEIRLSRVICGKKWLADFEIIKVTP